MKTFKIDLPLGAIYEHLHWKEDLDTDKEHFKDYTTVWVDTAKLISYAEKNPKNPMIPNVQAWDDDKRDRYIQGANPNDGIGLLCNPRVHFHDYEHEVIESKLFGLKKKRSVIKVQYVGFVNGRHRARIAEYLGAAKIPVQVNKDNVDVLLKFCSVNDEVVSVMGCNE